MAWTGKQKALVARGAKSVGLDDDARRLILRQLDGRALVEGKPTSTARALTNADFEQTMATLEHYGGGILPIKDREGRAIYGFKHWAGKQAAGPTGRQHARIDRLLARARATGLFKTDDILAGIIKQATGGRVDDDHRHAGITDSRRIADSIVAYGKRHGVVWGDLA